MFNLQRAYNWAVNMCNQPNVRYSQAYRNYRIIDGITYFDCSSFLFFALWLGGDLDIASLGYSTDLTDYREGRANAFTVNSMCRALDQLGWYRVAIDSQQWLPGDILVKTGTHCEMIYNAPSPLESMGARNPALPYDDQVAIHTVGTPSYYDRVYRDPSSPEPPHPGGRTHGPLPLWLLSPRLIKGGYRE